LWNFDEAGFCVGCAKGQWLLVPDDVLELYSLSPENRRSLTVFEAINATGSCPPPPVLVIEGKQLMQPRQQSGQEHVHHIYKSTRTLQKDGNIMSIIWTPSSKENELLGLAKGKAREATQQGATPQTQAPKMQSTTLNVARSKLGASKSLPETFGKHSKRVDTALPGKHTRQLYNKLSWKEASVLRTAWQNLMRISTESKQQ
jgi:hypothetical protein